LKENCKIDESKLEDAEIELSESISQEISSAYKQLSKEYGKDIEELVYGPNGFMATKYPNGLPDFRGDIIYSDKYWAEFEEWLEAQDQIEEDLEDDLTDQEFAEQLQAKLDENNKKRLVEGDKINILDYDQHPEIDSYVIVYPDGIH
jgi:hypothetical protein